jgi:pimeloyl-ACP methyl ester carboxylesterase
MQIHSLQGVSAEGFHTISYTRWAGIIPSPRTLLCVHGLTRNGRDFDFLAKALSDTHTIVCPDMVGRGQSDRLKTPLGYNFAQYVNDCTALIARLDVASVDWIGTSMGGLIGLMMAALPNSPIKRLIINDVGPFIKADAMAYIRDYAVTNPSFATFEEARNFLKTAYASFASKEMPWFWDHIAQHSVQQQEDGTYALLCDPGVAAGIPGGAVQDVDLWSLWDKITCPILVIRGKNSQILEEDTLQEMKKRQPQMDIYEVDGVGHAPSLAEENQIARVYDWLMSH